MSLLDLLNSKDPAVTQGLLQAGLSLLQSRGSLAPAIGRAGQAGTIGAQAYRNQTLYQTQEDLQNKLRESQLQQMQMQQQEQQQQQAQRAQLQQLAQQYSRSPQQTAMAQNGGPTNAAAAAVPNAQPGFDYQGYAGALAGINPMAALDLQGKLRKENPKLSRIEVMRGQDGNPINVALFEDGTSKVLPYGVKPEIALQNLGDRTVAIDKNAAQGGQEWKTGMGPADSQRIAQGWANVGISRDRLAFDKTGGVGAVPKPEGPPKPLPPAALKMQQEALDAMGVASAVNADLSALEKQIDKGDLSFGPVSNALNTARNMAGMSSEASRNFATFKSSLERLRNESLRLNAGVQTEGDAQRAWNELFQNINDTNLVKKRLGEIQNTNKRAAELQRLKVDQVRGNYGLQPIDTNQFTDLPSAVGGSSVKSGTDLGGGFSVK